MSNKRKQRKALRRIMLLIAGIHLLLSSGGSTGQERIGDVTREETLEKENQAVDLALDILGASGRQRNAQRVILSSSAVMVTLDSDNTPYLSSELTGHEIWHVTLTGAELELPSAPQSSEERYDRTFDVFLHPDGRLLKIVSRWPQGEPAIPDEPDAESTTDQLWRSGHEVYHAFPDEPPPISFVEALDALERGGWGPLSAKQIIAQYVSWSKLGRESHPMWVVTLRGIPAYEAAYPGVSVHARDHLRIVVDPTSERWVTAMSTPQPVVSEDERQAFAGGIPAGTVELYLFSTAHQQNVNAGDVISWQIEAAVSDLDTYGLSMFSVDFVQDSITPNPNLIDIPRAYEPDPLNDVAGFNRPAGISNPGPDGYGSGYGGTQIGLYGQKNLHQIGGGQNTFGVSGGEVGQDIVVEDDIGKGPAVVILAGGDFNAPCTPGTYTFSIENGVAYLLDVYPGAPDIHWEVKQATVDIPAATASFTFTVDPGPVCTGACCLPDNTCTVANEVACEDPVGLNGTYHGDDTVCAPDHGGVDCTMGACCRADGTCEDMTTFESCTGLSCPTGQNCPQHTNGGNEYMGAGTSCASSACDPPSTGACCIGEGTCLDGKTEFECNAAGGGYHDGISCVPDMCEGACCMPDQSCVSDQTAVQCYDAGGNYQGDRTDCNGMDCTTGACCLSTAACYEATEMSCDYEGGLYEGDGTDCTSTFCENCADGGAEVRCPNNERVKLEALDGALGDRFGSSVAVSGDVAVVGAPMKDNGADDQAGAAYVYRGFLNENCTTETPLIGSDTGQFDEFGTAVAVDGNLILVGAPHHYGSDVGTGAVYVFKYDGSKWDQEAELNASDASSHDHFGLSVAWVALSGGDGVAVIGAPDDNHAAGGNAGSAYVFRRYEDNFGCATDEECANIGLTKCNKSWFCDGVAWVEDPTKLIASDASQAAKFGTDVDIDSSGMTIVVGAPMAIEVPIFAYSGKAYVFEYELGDWVEKAGLVPQNPMPNNSMPIAVSVADAGEVVLVGAPWDDDACDPPTEYCESGAAYVYNRPVNGWTGDLNEDARLTSCDMASNGRFGWSVSLSAAGDAALVGAPFHGIPSFGAGYAFLFDGVIWAEEGKLTPAVGLEKEKLGFSTDLDGGVAILGAPTKGGAPGSAYIYQGIGDCDATGSLDICDILADPSVDFPLAHDCCETGHGAGCSDEPIEDCVCNTGPNPDPFCCETYWDAVCAALVDPACASCGEGNGIPIACEGCPPDFDRSGAVLAPDLARLLGAWGPCAGGCVEDLTGDCEVGAPDLAILLGSWGPCPDPSEAQWNGGPDGSGALRFAFGSGNGCLSLEAVVQMLGYDDVGEFIEWVLSAVPPEEVYQVALFLLWLLQNWPC